MTISLLEFVSMNRSPNLTTCPCVWTIFLVQPNWVHAAFDMTLVVLWHYATWVNKPCGTMFSESLFWPALKSVSRWARQLLPNKLDHEVWQLWHSIGQCLNTKLHCSLTCNLTLAFPWYFCGHQKTISHKTAYLGFWMSAICRGMGP